MLFTPLIAALLFLWIIFILFWRVMSMFVKQPVERAPLPERMSYNIPLFFGFAFLLMSFGSWAWHPLTADLLPHTRLAGFLGFFITAAGVGVAVWSRIALGANWSHSIVLLERHRLVTHGPYAYMRHPIYTGLLLMFLGTAAAIGTVGGAVGFVFLFISCWVKLLSEERLMLKRFPEAYLQYSRKVKRLIPFFL
jgi:protein-S-isoprenylcysteine O-methyltransferase Ste14